MRIDLEDACLCVMAPSFPCLEIVEKGQGKSGFLFPPIRGCNLVISEDTAMYRKSEGVV